MTKIVAGGLLLLLLAVAERVDSNARSDVGNAWSSGGGIDWGHVAAGGQPNSNRGSTSSSSSSRRGSSGSSSNRGSSGSSGGTPGGPAVSVSRTDLRRLAQSLLDADSNSVGDLVTLRTQGRTSFSGVGDRATQSLISVNQAEVLRGRTFSTFYALLDNYDPDVQRSESDTQQELEEQQAFLNAVMDTSVMTKAAQFLREKRLISKPFREVLQEIWFTPYTRHRRTVGSSGFEHVFVGESKDNKVSGFHNWLAFYKEEQEGDLNYYGYMKNVDLGPKASLIQLKFMWSSDPKDSGSMFVGTSPEFEMALYTVCFFAKPGANCPVELNDYRFSIKTYYQNYHGKRLVGTAFPLVN